MFVKCSCFVRACVCVRAPACVRVCVFSWIIFVWRIYRNITIFSRLSGISTSKDIGLLLVTNDIRKQTWADWEWRDSGGRGGGWREREIMLTFVWTSAIDLSGVHLVSGYVRGIDNKPWKQLLALTPRPPAHTQSVTQSQLRHWSVVGVGKRRFCTLKLYCRSWEMFPCGG